MKAHVPESIDRQGQERDARYWLPTVARSGRGVLSLIAALALVAWADRSHAESLEGPELVVGKNVHVSWERLDLQHVEPYLAADPEDPASLVAVAISVDPRGRRNSAGYHSGDAGQTWRRSELPACGGDPWVAFGATKEVFASCMSRFGGDGGSPTVAVYRSHDGGRQWSLPAYLPMLEDSAADRPVVVAGPGSSSAPGQVYVAFGGWYRGGSGQAKLFGVQVSQSTNGGVGFSLPEVVSHNNLRQQPADVALLGDGDLSLLFVDFADVNGQPLGHRRIWLSKSPFEALRVSLPRLILEQTGREMPGSMAVDRMVRPERIYVVVDGDWNPAREPSPTAKGGRPPLFLVHSDDYGERWSEPVAVVTEVGSNSVETPALAVNRDGIVGVAWYDTRNDGSGSCFDIYFSASVDRGASFLPAVRVTSESSCPAAVVPAALARSFPFGGHYSGLASAADGRFHVLWSDARNGRYETWTTSISVGGSGAPSGGG